MNKGLPILIFIISLTVGCTVHVPEIVGLEQNQNLKGAYLLPSGRNSQLVYSDLKDDSSINKNEVIAFNFAISRLTNDLFECRSCTGGAGLEISGYKFFIEKNVKDLRLYIGEGKISDIPYYIIDGHGENIVIRIYIKYSKNGFSWVVKSLKRTVGGTFEVSLTEPVISQFIYLPVSGSNLSYTVSDLRIDKLKLPEFEQAEIHPLYKYKATATAKVDWNAPAADYLIWDKTSDNITNNELKGFEEYLLRYELPMHNHLNYYFRKRFNSYMLEWVYEKNNNINLLNKAIQVAENAVNYRNDNFGKYKISFDRRVAPVWPNFKEVEVYEDGSIGLAPGASVFAGLPAITVPIHIISKDSSIWGKEFNGRSYKEIALSLIDEALKTIDYTYETFVGNDTLIRYPTTMHRKEWHNKLFIYNRVFPIISGSIPLVEALEVFNIFPEKKRKIDNINQAMINRLKRDMVFFKVNGRECVKYPYSEAMQIKNPNKVEDFTHGAFDSRDFQLFFESKRYGFSKRYVDAMANNLVEVTNKKEKGFSQYIDGSGKPRHFPTLISYIGYIWYASFRPELYDILVDYIVKNNIVIKNGRYDSYFIYEILKLKEKSSKNEK